MHLAWRWFTGLGFDQEIAHHSTFSKNRHGRFRESKLFDQLFEQIVRQCVEVGLMQGKQLSVDGVSECDSLQRAVSLIPTEKPFSKYLRAGADKVKSLSPHHRFAIALHSPNGVVETDCACALQRKKPETLLAGFDWTLSPVLFAGKTCGIAAIFSDSCSNAARFLCNPDCVRSERDSNFRYRFRHAPKRPCFSDLLRFHRRSEQTRETD